MGNRYGARIKAAREKRQLKAAYIARRLGVSPATYSQIETGKRLLTAERLESILTILSMRWDELKHDDEGGGPSGRKS